MSAPRELARIGHGVDVRSNFQPVKLGQGLLFSVANRLGKSLCW
jgi:hypothetical protein